MATSNIRVVSLLAAPGGGSSDPLRGLVLSQCPVATWPAREEVLRSLEALSLGVLREVGAGRSPTLTYASRVTWDNVRYTPEGALHMVPEPEATKTSIRFDSILSVNKFALMLKLVSEIYSMVQENTFCTKRDLYYRAPQEYGTQAVLDDLVDNLCCLLATPRWALHVLATSKGLVYGDLQFRDDDGNFINCQATDTGILVPNHVMGIHNVQCGARFVLVVEKDATFQKLLDDGFCAREGPCLLVTGKGFPDVNTRLLLRRLRDTCHVPMFALVDADPHGIEIMCVYRFGSRSLSFEANSLVVPEMKWLGLLPSDVERLQLNDSAQMTLTAKDVEKSRDLLRRPYVTQNPAVQREVETLLKRGKKAEIQSLCSINSTFLSEVFLPSKLRCGGWV